MAAASCRQSDRLSPHSMASPAKSAIIAIISYKRRRQNRSHGRNASAKTVWVHSREWRTSSFNWLSASRTITIRVSESFPPNGPPKSICYLQPLWLYLRAVAASALQFPLSATDATAVRIFFWGTGTLMNIKKSKSLLKWCRNMESPILR
jgi:hypothetical protein